MGAGRGVHASFSVGRDVDERMFFLAGCDGEVLDVKTVGSGVFMNRVPMGLRRIDYFQYF